LSGTLISDMARVAVIIEADTARAPMSEPAPKRSPDIITRAVGGNPLWFRRHDFVLKFHKKRCVWSFYGPELCPPIVPSGHDQNFYLVINNYGNFPAFPETDVDKADLETTINDLMSGQYSDPVRVVAFNAAEHWAGDASEDVAREIMCRLDLAGDALPSSIAAFVDSHLGPDRQLTMRLA
jgi:hypothetical protein